MLLGVGSCVFLVTHPAPTSGLASLLLPIFRLKVSKSRQKPDKSTQHTSALATDRRFKVLGSTFRAGTLFLFKDD